jgi:hypothetical protein
MKYCFKCKVEKSLDSFAKLSKNKVTGRQSYCKVCSNDNRKEVYNSNLEREYSRKRTLRLKYAKENMGKIFSYLREKGCKDCGERDPIVLEFDHIANKKFTISNKVMGAAWDTLFEEIQKCDVRCANCHRRKTAKERNFYKYLEGHDNAK